ncbi:MAG: glycosyltransferase family 4 protein [Pedobacter sp.]|nr:glycosyltransferase family 4 protein [Pedobacter sp.]
MVFYTWGEAGASHKFDPGFGKQVTWDLPLLEGYPFTFVHNQSTVPGSHHRKGIINPTLINDIKKWGADAVLVFGWNFVSHLAVMRYFYGKIPVLFRGDSTLLDERIGWKKLFRRLYLKRIYRHIDIAFYTGTCNKLYFKVHGLKEAQLIYAPHAVDNERFFEPQEKYQLQADAWREQLGFNQKDVVLLFAGKLEAKKNPFYLLDVLRQNTHPDLKLLFVGSGHLEKVLKKEAESDKRIVFIDFQNQLQMPVLYRVADLLVLPSIGPGETWGLVLNEAMACGKAVAASILTGGAFDLIKEGKNGIIFNPNDTLVISELLQQALNNKNCLTQMGLQSKKIIHSFSFLQITIAITQSINKL